MSVFLASWEIGFYEEGAQRNESLYFASFRVGIADSCKALRLYWANLADYSPRGP